MALASKRAGALIFRLRLIIPSGAHLSAGFLKPSADGIVCHMIFLGDLLCCPSGFIKRYSLVHIYLFNFYFYTMQLELMTNGAAVAVVAFR